MSTNKQALRNSADRDWFEEWFKKEYHPNKTGPYIKDQMFFAIQAARAPLLDELEAATDSIREHMVELIAARNRIAELEAREVKLPQRQEPTSSGHYGEGYLVPSDTGSALEYEDTVEALAAAGISVKGE